MVRGQMELLQELTGNLIDNAIRYAGDGSTVTVRVAQEADDTALLQVIDNGPGIAEAEREDVFRRFYRGESGQGVEGTGLGLPIVREIARLHQATAGLDERPAAG